MNKYFYLLILLVLFLGIPIWGKTDLSTFPIVKIKRIDQTKEDPSFYQTYKELISVVEKKDYQKIKEYLSEAHVSNFECSKDIFDECWGLTEEKYKNSKLWNLLYTALKKGGAKDGEYYVFPYYFVTFPEDYDAFDYSFIDGENVNIRSKPNINSSVVENYSYVIVLNAGESPKNKETIGGVTDYWYSIITPSGKKGYVFGKFLSSPIGCRVFFKKDNGKWLIQYIACGD